MFCWSVESCKYWMIPLNGGWIFSTGLVGSLFLGGGKAERRSWSVAGPAMELCVAGCCSGSPMFWTKKLQLVCSRKSVSGLCFNNIREDEKPMKLWKKREQSDRLFQVWYANESVTHSFVYCMFSSMVLLTYFLNVECMLYFLSFTEVTIVCPSPIGNMKPIPLV